MWKWEVIQPLEKTVWQFLETLVMCLPCDPTMLALDRYLREMKVCIHTRTFQKCSQQLFLKNQVPKTRNNQNADE